MAQAAPQALAHRRLHAEPAQAVDEVRERPAVGAAVQMGIALTALVGATQRETFRFQHGCASLPGCPRPAGEMIAATCSASRALALCSRDLMVPSGTSR